MLRRLMIVVCLACVIAVPALAVTLKPPGTARVVVSTTYWGVAVQDPYRWLEDGQSAKTSAWIDAQNSYAASVFATYRQADAIGKRLRQLAITGPQQFDAKIVAGKLFFL